MCSLPKKTEYLADVLFYHGEKPKIEHIISSESLNDLIWLIAQCGWEEDDLKLSQTVYVIRESLSDRVAETGFYRASADSSRLTLEFHPGGRVFRYEDIEGYGREAIET